MKDLENGVGIELNDLNKRFKLNEKFFSSFLDMVPANVYLNYDDRVNWIKMIKSDKKKRQMPSPNEPKINGGTKLSTKNSTNASDEEEEEKSGDDENELDIVKLNKFEPKYFKTVSQILKDFEEFHQKNKKFNSQQRLFKLNKPLSFAQSPKSTAIKVSNKAQNKSKQQSSDSANTNDENSNEAGVLKKSSQNGAQKRASKFKEEKREAVKRVRQRYDSQTEPQIVNIPNQQITDSSVRKPILNKNGQVVFSKFDFTADKTLKTKKVDTKLSTTNAKPKDYKKLLKKLEQKKEKFEELKQQDPEKASELEIKDKWKSAIDKAAGVKVKDDVGLLTKAVKRIEKKKEKSRKSWDDRKKDVESRKQMAQDKRRKNLDKRKEKNRERKIKKLKKKGRILPGF